MLRSCLQRPTLVFLVFALCLPLVSAADPRPHDALDAAQLRHALQKLQVTGTALYVAAHPDDENTALLAWLSQERKVRTVYLSMTRGDGGQNLIGDEFGAELGLIRTQELLAARRVDGAEQRFTRALDFGFSKGPEETMAIWGRDSVLSDVVWTIRSLRPDIIIDRFGTDGSGGHGHHTASAMLAEEAFVAAADPKRFPEQLRWVKPWKAKRIFWNAWTPSPDSKVDSMWLRVDIGSYNPVLGRSYSEIAAVSRSNHKSQGFGSGERRGSIPTYLALRAGEPARADIFDAVDLSWKRYPGGQTVAALLAEAEKRYDPTKPQALLPLLGKAYAELAKLGDEPLLAVKREELANVMRSCAGLWLEAVALTPSATPGGELRVATSALVRTSTGTTLESVNVAGAAVNPARVLIENLPANDTLRVQIAPGVGLTQPYWRTETASKGLFAVRDRADLGMPENRPAVEATFRVRLGGVSVPFALPVAYRSTDPVLGERWRMLEVTPPATLQLDHAVYLFPNALAHPVELTITSRAGKVEGTVSLALPAGWNAVPAAAPVRLAKVGEEARVRFSVTPSAGPATGTLAATIHVAGVSYSRGLVRIDHAHIPVQTLFPPCEARLVRADVRIVGTRVGYVMGSGDPVPDALRQLGYQVTLLTDGDLEGGDLARFDAIVTGVRAYNTRPRLGALQQRLLDYANAGGTVVVQYNTTADGPMDFLGPFPFRISRDRVTVEEADVRFLKPGHRLLTIPNAISVHDFDGWVQERGLYFANPVDPRDDTPLSANDPGEPARDGGLLYATHGKGCFIYCAYAMFRQLPAGVPGAYRLFANLVSAKP
ncbi:MAG: PIG-L family deacetylase [Candidatus Eisenbacteria bacterium]